MFLKHSKKCFLKNNGYLKVKKKKCIPEGDYLSSLIKKKVNHEIGNSLRSGWDCFSLTVLPSHL